ncbi:MAG: potassium transporter Kup [Rhodospirillales bacterium RIFCSPLOWO2_12_FULL_67_15]|nr:MAG: potassium transporter Kup [Rhodospirillales bacterium RIFCSPLOWO2_12_FULL_67_15]
MFAALGVVFGDIGTSPLYAIKETFAGSHPLPLDRPHLFGILSLVFWSIMFVVSIKYVIVLMRADNRGEGGSLALLALVTRAATARPWLVPVIGTLGIFAAGLFYGDTMLTPAISVLSAVEGLKVVGPWLEPWVLPLTAVILVLLFMIQRQGTAMVGAVFGAVILVWFAVLAMLGIKNIGLNSQVLWALSPHHAAMFLWNDGLTGFLALGSVVLVVTGAEALYADMGHFGRLPIRLAWYLIVLPGLMLNYFGQGALLLADPKAIENPFFLMSPEWAILPMVILATLATVIASQATISGAFSITQQAIQLGYIPRMAILHTSAKEIGQIYLPFVNWLLMICVLALVLGFQSSSNLAAAYGVAVTGTMTITTLLVGAVMLLLWNWSWRKTVLVLAVFLLLDLAFFGATVTKIEHGGWFPLAVGFVIFVLLTTWKHGRNLLLARRTRAALSIEEFKKSLSDRIARVPGTAIFFTRAAEGVPAALLHNLKHNKVLHERVVLLTLKIEEVPFVPPERRVTHEDFGGNLGQVTLHFGFMDTPDIPKAIANATEAQLGFFYDVFSTTYFLSRETVIPVDTPDMVIWRKYLFAWMTRNASGAAEFFQLPRNRVVELGAQVEV